MLTKFANQSLFRISPNFSGLKNTNVATFLQTFSQTTAKSTAFSLQTPVNTECHFYFDLKILLGYSSKYAPLKISRFRAVCTENYPNLMKTAPEISPNLIKSSKKRSKSQKLHSNHA
jgi:hypothetical protein